jgi:uncharacterized protein
MKASLKEWQGRFVAWLEINWVHGDQSHDIHHLHRVWRNCQRIAAGEEGDHGDAWILLPAAYFHDLVAVAKNSPDRSRSSWLSAEQMTLLMAEQFPDYPRNSLAGIHHAIHAHSFSAGVPAKTIEAKILQDADRLEALGAIGIARMFYTAGKLGGALSHPDDPMGHQRNLDDARYALDHIELKLLKLPALMQTETGRRIAADEALFIRRYREKFVEEMNPDSGI